MLSPAGRDDCPAFFADLRSRVPLRVLSAPAAAKRIPDFPRFLGYLSTLGALSFHAVLPRADIAVWAYYRLLRRDERRRLIASACAGVTSRLRRDGGPALNHLPPVPSPLRCTAIHLRKYLGYGEPLAFLSPCALKWTEFHTEDGTELVSYNATIRGIRTHLERENIDLTAYPALFPEDGGLGSGLTVGSFGGVASSLERALPGTTGRVELGMRRVLASLPEWLDGRSPEPLFEPYACSSGCDGGSGVGLCPECPHHIPGALSDPTAFKPSREALLDLFARFDRELDPRDFAA